MNFHAGRSPSTHVMPLLHKPPRVQCCTFATARPSAAGPGSWPLILRAGFELRVAVKLLCDSVVLSAPAWLIRTCLMTRLLAISRQVKTPSSYISVLLTCSFVHLSHLLSICSSWKETLANVDISAGLEHIMGSFCGLNAEPTT